MARKARVKSSTGRYIIMLRGMEDTLFKAKNIKDLFLKNAEERFGGKIEGIRFFSDRVVMLVKESDKGISVDMKPVLISFARSYNGERGTDGKVFMDRFKSIPVEDKAFLTICTDYVNGDSNKDPFGVKTEAKPSQAPAKPKAAPKKKSAPKKAEPKPVEKPKEVEKEPQKPPVKRRNEMPTWLL